MSVETTNIEKSIATSGEAAHVTSLPPVKYNVTQQVIEDLKQTHVPFKVTNTAERKEIAARIADIRNLRLSIESRRKELKKDAIEYGKQVDDIAKGIFAQLEPIEEALEAAKKEYDDEKARQKAEEERLERVRVEGIQEKIAYFQKALVFKDPVITLEELTRRIDKLEGLTVVFEEYAEFVDQAIRVKDEVLAELKDKVEAVKAAEAARLADEEKRRQEAAALEAEKVRQEEERQKLAAEKAELDKKRQDEEAERAKREADEKVKRDAEAEAERQRIAQERAQFEEEKRQAQAKLDEEKRIADEKAKAAAEAEERARQEREALEAAQAKAKADDEARAAAAVAAAAEPALVAAEEAAAPAPQKEEGAVAHLDTALRQARQHGGKEGLLMVLRDEGQVVFHWQEPSGRGHRFSLSKDVALRFAEDIVKAAE